MRSSSGAYERTSGELDIRGTSLNIYPGPDQCQPNPLVEKTRIDMALSEFMRYFTPVPGTFGLGSVGFRCLYRSQFFSIPIIAELTLFDERNFATADLVKHAGTRVYFRCWYDLDPLPVSDPLAGDENKRVVWGGEARCFFVPGDPFISSITIGGGTPYQGFMDRFQADPGGGDWWASGGAFNDYVGCGGITNLIQAGAINGGPVLVPPLYGTEMGSVYRPRGVLFLNVYDPVLYPDPRVQVLNGLIGREYNEWDVLGSLWSWPWIGPRVVVPPVSFNIVNGDALVAACFFSDWQVRFKGSLYAGLRGNSV